MKKDFNMPGIRGGYSDRKWYGINNDEIND